MSYSITGMNITYYAHYVWGYNWDTHFEFKLFYEMDMLPIACEFYSEVIGVLTLQFFLR